MRVPASVLQARLRGASSPVRILKADGERRFVMGLAYGPGRLDGHGEYMTPETVENAAWGYMRAGGRIVVLQHADGTEGVAEVVESMVYRGPDWSTTDAQGNTQIIKAGDWLLGAIFDERAWQLIKDGRLTGWSIDGIGNRVTRSRKNLEGDGG